MASSEPLAQWLIAQIGTLDKHAFRMALPEIGASFTLSLWFYAMRYGGRQVIARLNSPDVDGWGVVLENQRITVEYGRDDSIIARAEGPIAGLEHWAHVALTFAAETGCIRVFAGADTGEATIDPIDPSVPRELILGGYTDPAGGHYDYTFGRDGTGLVDDVRIYGRVLDADEIAGLSQIRGDPPVADFSIGAVGDAPCVVSFSANGSEGTRGVVWNFGDGSMALGRSVEHRFDYAGQYRIQMTAISAGHRQSSAEATLMLAGADDPIQRTRVFVNGGEGHACYRIPSIVRAANGDLLAFAEGRRDSCSDSTPTIRVVSKRSRDNGRTWEPLQIVAQHLHAAGEYALMNPSPVVDSVRGDGRIVLLYNASTSNEWDLARGVGQSQTFCVISYDHGETWDEPREISDEIRGASHWPIQRPTLGHALQRRDGRIIHASTITVGVASVFDSQNVLFWSDDLGESWHCGGVCPTVGLNEATAIELEDGSVLINSRAYIGGKPAGRRALTRAYFGHDDQVYYDPTLYVPALVDSAAQASMLRLTFKSQIEAGGRSRIAFSNPAHPHARYHLTVRLSDDEGQTWSHQRVIDAGPSSYSDLIEQADGRIGVLYEQGNQGGIAYAIFTLEWLTNGTDSLDRF